MVCRSFTPLCCKMGVMFYQGCSAEQYGFSREGAMGKGYVERVLRPFLDASSMGPVCCCMIICMQVLSYAEGTCGIKAERSS